MSKGKMYKKKHFSLKRNVEFIIIKHQPRMIIIDMEKIIYNFLKQILLTL